METKTCYSCCEEIKLKAKQCPHCQSHQTTFNRVIRSPVAGPLIGILIIWIFFASSFNRLFGNNAIYDPDKILAVSESNYQFIDASCGKQVAVVGTITNKGKKPLAKIVFDVEFYDASGKVIDAISDTEYDLVLPPGSSKKFKITGKSGANQNIYSKHKIVVAKAEPDR